MRLWTCFLLCAIALEAGQSALQPDAPRDPVQRRISISVEERPLLLVLVEIGRQEDIPVGIALDRSDAACIQRKAINFQNGLLAEFLSSLLAGTKFRWAFENGVIVIQPIHMPQQVSRVLSIRFDQFRGPKTTMQGMGISLWGWIYSRLKPGAGFAGDILASPDAEQFSLVSAKNVSVKQILNHIVSFGSKGVWIVGPPQTPNGQEAGFELRTYSYRDDARNLNTLCSGSIRLGLSRG